MDLIHLPVYGYYKVTIKMMLYKKVGDYMGNTKLSLEKFCNLVWVFFVLFIFIIFIHVLIISIVCNSDSNKDPFYYDTRTSYTSDYNNIKVNQLIDDNTGVIYFITETGYVCPRYNADGTLMNINDESR